MYVRAKRRGKGTKYDYEYLQIVEGYRNPGSRQVRQRVIATLGRCDFLVEKGGLDKLIGHLTRFRDQYKGQPGTWGGARTEDRPKKRVDAGKWVRVG